MHELIKKASPSGTGEAERKEGHDNTELDSHAVDGIAPIGMAEAAECADLERPGIQRCCFNSCAAGVSSSAAVWIPRLQCHKPPCFLNYRRFKPLAHGDDVPPAYRGDIHPYLLVTSQVC